MGGWIDGYMDGWMDGEAFRLRFEFVPNSLRLFVLWFRTEFVPTSFRLRFDFVPALRSDFVPNSFRHHSDVVFRFRFFCFVPISVFALLSARIYSRNSSGHIPDTIYPPVLFV